MQEAWLRLSRSDADERREPRRLADDGRRARVPQHAALARPGARSRSRTARPRPDRRAAPTASIPEHEALLADSVGLALLVVLETLPPGRAARVRAARHVRRAVRRDRADRRPLARPPPASSPAAPGAACRAPPPAPDADLPRAAQVVDAFFAAARDGDFDALVAVLDPDVVLRSDGGPASAIARRPGRENVAAPALTFARLAPFVRPALVNGAAGVVVTRDGRPFSVMGFTVAGGRIVAIDSLADPERLRNLDLTVLD